ncbi:DUF2218 domain-containing protein [Paracoccus rhizosphaerae]|uniref:DUF2218 domain-containing protein n=1 Tax=Paracoccus rhizosphaerae TaxID=1133347 RepID=A0ABV6CJ88_9RHOB|nr:DUF2218 domain-containing protein [Paracoccus rhizosphaerae]
MQIIADFPTVRGQALIGTMTKHFGHKIPVTLTDDQAELRFEMGEARVSVIPNGLRLALTAEDADRLERLRDVVERHLLRFAHREDPAPLDWMPVPA